MLAYPVAAILDLLSWTGLWVELEEYNRCSSIFIREDLLFKVRHIFLVPVIFTESDGQFKVFSSLFELIETYMGMKLLTKPYKSAVPSASYFHGDLSSEEANELLSNQPPGTFLLRFSSLPGCFAICFVDQSQTVQKDLITRTVGGFQLSHSGPVYPSIQAIVEYFTEQGVLRQPLL